MPQSLTISVPMASKPINTYGFYYVPSESDRFVAGTGEQTISTTDFVASANDQPSTLPSSGASSHHDERDAVKSPQSVATSTDNSARGKTNDEIGGNNDSVAAHRGRRTNTGKKIQLRRERQSYDMNLVPNVQGNKEYLQAWRQISTSTANNDDFSKSLSLMSLPSLVPCDGSITDIASECKSGCPSPSLSEQGKEPLALERCSRCSLEEENNTNVQKSLSHQADDFPSPFTSEFESVIWEPQERNHWNDSIDEMTAVCTAASRHRHEAMKKPLKDFSPPISNDYVKERVDIDDPLRGYQIRHKTGGWLQGFVMTTTFTSWTYYFKWDSLNREKNGFETKGKRKGLEDDGTLAEELDKQARSGDPKDKGVVWPAVAEIVLVGALACGEYLVQMALDKMLQQGYEYVVLEATDSSRLFYEKLGFTRVGAVAKYGTRPDFENSAESIELKGYSHWAPADSTAEQLTARGPPSCMMARRLKRPDPPRQESCTNCMKMNPSSPSFLQQLSRHFVQVKPAIRPLGNSTRKRSFSRVITPIGEKVAKAPETSSSQKIRRIGTVSGRVRKFHASPLNISNLRPSRKMRTISNDVVPTELNHFQPPIKPTIGNSLLKQDIANMYRHPKTIYFYNKVVTPKTLRDVHKSKYYFVLHYYEETKTIRLIPLYKSGVFTKGQRMGKQKWKSNVLLRNLNMDEQQYLQSMDVVHEPCDDWSIVQSYMVTKCKSVASESWDILE